MVLRSDLHTVRPAWATAGQGPAATKRFSSAGASSCLLKPFHVSSTYFFLSMPLGVPNPLTRKKDSKSPSPNGARTDRSQGSANVNGSGNNSGVNAKDGSRSTNSSNEKSNDLSEKLPNGTSSPVEGRPSFAWRKIGGWDSLESSDDKLHTLQTLKAVENYVMDHLYGDWYFNTVMILGVSFFSWFFAFWGFSILMLGVVLLGAASVYRAEFRRFNRDIRDDMARIDARNRLENEIETMEWMNSFLAKFWVIYMPALSEMVLFQANEILKDQAPGFGIEKVSLDEFTLGSKAPRVDAIKSYTRKGSDHIEMDWAFSFTPNDTDDMTKNEIKKKINPKVALGVTIGKAFISKSLPILVEDMSFTGRMKIKLILTENFPHVKLVSVQFLEPPAIDYALKPVGGDTLGIDIMSFIPGLSTFVNSIIHSTLRPMLYAPNSLDIDVEDLMSQQSNDSIGLLTVNVKRAYDIKCNDLEGKECHPYVQLTLSGGPDVDERTKIKKNTRKPVFLESKHLLVNGLEGNLLTFNVFSYVPDKAEDIPIGRVDFDLADLLQESHLVDQTKNITDAGRIVGKLNFDLKWNHVLEKLTLEDGLKEENIDCEIGIMKFSLFGAYNLDISKSVVGLLNPYAEVYINDQHVKTTRKLRQINEPSWGLTFESLITQQSQTRVQVFVKDSIEDTIVGRLDTNLQDLIFESSRGQQWITAAPIRRGGPATKFRIGVKWSALPLGDESLKFFEEPAIGGFRLQIRNAKGLINLEEVGDVDPYIRVSQNGKPKGRTPTIANTSNPHWNQVFFLPVANPHQHILLEIFDAEPEGKDRPLGSCAVTVNDYLKKNNEGYYLGYDGAEEIIEQPVLYAGKNHGHLYYSVSFVPTLPIYTLSQLENLDTFLEMKKEKETEEKKKMEEEERLYKENPEGYEWVELQDDVLPEPEKVELPLEKAIKYRTGVLMLHVLEGHFKASGCLVHTLFDDHAFSSSISRRAEGKNLTDPFNVEAFIRDLPNSLTIFRVSKKYVIEHKNDIVAEKTFKTADLLKKAYQKPLTLKIDEKNSIKIRAEYIPSAVKLAPLDTVLDVGHVKLDILSAENLKSVDSNGKSDPMVVIKLDGVEIFKTDKKRRTLDPVWNEAFEFPILSRSRQPLVLEVYDWDLTNDDELLGTAVIDISAIDPNDSTQFKVELDTQGVVVLRATFKPEYVRPPLSTKSGLPIDLSDVKGVPLKLVGGVAGVAGNTVGSGVGLVSDNITKGGQFFKSFGKSKKRSGEDTRSQNGHGNRPLTQSQRGAPSELDKSMQENGEEDNEPDLLSEQVDDTSQFEKEGEKEDDNKSKKNRQGAPPPEEQMEQNRPPSIEGALPNVDPDLLPPPQRPGEFENHHKRSTSEATDISTMNSSAMGPNGLPGRVNIVLAKGFKASALDVKVTLSTPQRTKDIYKTRGAKSHGGAFKWNETFTFKSPPVGTLSFAVREHKTLGRSQIISSAEVALSDHLDASDTIDLIVGNGQLTVFMSYLSGH